MVIAFDFDWTVACGGWPNITKAKLNKILAENTGKPIEVIAADTERDNFMTAEEALEYGLVDKIMYKR